MVSLITEAFIYVCVCTNCLFFIYEGFLIDITNNTPDMAEIQDLQLAPREWWSPRLPTLLSGQGGAAFGEVHKIMFVNKTFIYIRLTAMTM